MDVPSTDQYKSTAAIVCMMAVFRECLALSISALVSVGQMRSFISAGSRGRDRQALSWRALARSTGKAMCFYFRTGDGDADVQECATAGAFVTRPGPRVRISAPRLPQVHASSTESKIVRNIVKWVIASN